MVTFYSKAEFEEQVKIADGLLATVKLYEEQLMRATRMIESGKQEIDRLLDMVEEMSDESAENRRLRKVNHDYTQDVLHTQERLNDVELVLKHLINAYIGVYQVAFKGKYSITDSIAYTRARHVSEGGRLDESIRDRYSDPAGPSTGTERRGRSSDVAA